MRDRLTDCDAPTPEPEICDGLDNDCDDDIDEETCDDENPCTEDVCLGVDGCNHIPVDAGECMDGDPCTVADHCEAGACVGSAVECDDKNPCTEDSCTATGGCEFTPVFGPCDDGDPCTAGDLCDEGVCAGTSMDCACMTDDDCATLEDGDLCNGTLLCDTAGLPYQCAVDPATMIECPLPEGPDAPCLAAACDPTSGACSLVPAFEGAPCEDGDLCTLGDTCSGGICGAGAAVNCNDGNPCTDEACQPDQGCVFTLNSAPCQDGDACTSGDACSEGACVPGLAIDCDDGNTCTADTCLPALGCSHTPQDGACEDGNLCTNGEQCDAGSCGLGEPVVCDDDNLCTTDTCTPALGCVFTFNEVPCNDDSLCTTGDHCHLGSCIGAQLLVCDDMNPCTDDACSALTGCTFTQNTAPCDDGNACTTGEQCAGGWCLGDAVVCDDSEVCTDDACDPMTGCTFTPNAEDCDDGDACTEGDACSGGACAGLTISCDDLEPCTTDGCDPQSGCTHTPLPDETDCGQNLWCQAGVCVEHVPEAVTFDTFNYNGMTGWPLDFEACGCCGGTTTQEQMDALCELAGYATAESWEASPQYINTCYCWGSCSGYTWYSGCCSGWQTQVMVTQVTCI